MIEIRRGRWWFQFVLFAVTVSLALGGLSASAQSPSPSLVRTIRAAHIFIAPDHDPGAASAGTATEEAWAAAESDAIAIATELRSITDPTARADRFAELARMRSDDTTTRANGGDLGAFTRDLMVPEFGDPLFDTPSLAPGDILGPVQSGFGWHVILYQGEATRSLSRVKHRSSTTSRPLLRRPASPLRPRAMPRARCCDPNLHRVPPR